MGLEALKFTLKVECGAFLVIGVWLYVCLAISLPNPWKMFMMWSLIVGLTIPVAVIDYIRKAGR